MWCCGVVNASVQNMVNTAAMQKALVTLSDGMMAKCQREQQLEEEEEEEEEEA